MPAFGKPGTVRTKASRFMGAYRWIAKGKGSDSAPDPAPASTSHATSATRAEEGPSAKRSRKAAIDAASPSAQPLTAPSGSLRTKPARPRDWACVSTHQRKPTPWTRPVMRKVARARCVIEDASNSDHRDPEHGGESSGVPLFLHRNFNSQLNGTTTHLRPLLTM